MRSKTKSNKPPLIKRGDVCVVALDPVIGSEIKKTRPAVVISNNHMNSLAQTVIVMPMSTGTHAYYHWIPILPPEGGLKSASRIVTDQVRTIDKKRIQKTIGKVSPRTLILIEKAIRNNFALPEGDILETRE